MEAENIVRFPSCNRFREDNVTESIRHKLYVQTSRAFNRLPRDSLVTSCSFLYALILLIPLIYPGIALLLVILLLSPPPPSPPPPLSLLMLSLCS